MVKQLPEKLITLLNEVKLNVANSTWDCHGTPVVLHKALEKIASKKGIQFDDMQVIESSVKEKYAVISVRGHYKDATVQTIGEAAPYNTTNKYPFAMAEKRAKDRVILKLLELSGDVYSEEEADDFKQSKPEPTKLMNLDTEARVDAAIEFYETCSAEKFKEFEKRYKNLLNAPDIGEPEYDAVVNAHEKRKKELGI